jgi:hypothetical protein
MPWVQEKPLEGEKVGLYSVQYVHVSMVSGAKSGPEQQKEFLCNNLINYVGARKKVQF